MNEPPKQKSSEMSPTIIPCEARHIDEIAAIYRHAVRHGTASFELEPPDEEEMLSRWQALTSAGYPYLVAEFDGEVAGYAYAGPYRARPAYRATVENSVYVHSQRQGRGVGHLLMHRLIDACTDLGFRQMIAVIGDSANISSQRLHERLGFEPVGVLKSVGWKHQRWLDTVLMQRPLGSPRDWAAPAPVP